jgi:hypothetical protein
VSVVANKVRDDHDEAFIREQVPREDLLGIIHYSGDVSEADRRCASPYDTAAQTVEEIRAIKNKMGHHSNKYLVSVMSHYKNRIRQMENDMRSVVLHVEDTCSPESFAAYTKMVEAYTHVASCRRVWLYDETKRDRYRQVFLDLGVFDYIRSDCYLPMLRDDRGVEYYFLPTALIIARSHVDFDVRPLKDLTVVCQELAIEEPTEALLSRIGDAASMIKIPELNLNYYFNHVRYIVNFVHALDELKATL